MTERTAFVTGASTGIGAACALELDRRGFRVFAGVRAEAAGEALRQQASDRLTPVRIDVTEAESIAAAGEAIEAAVGPAGLWGLVNNAGVAVPGPIEFVPLEDVRRQFEVNVIGQVAVTQRMLPLLRRARGRIVNMGSISGKVAAPFVGLYAASKHALEALSDALRVELRRWDIQVSIVEPASIKTPIWEKARAWSAEALAQISPQAKELYGDDLRVARESIDRFDQHGLPVERVVRAVVHALTARRAKPRYPVGYDSHVAFALWSLLPTRLRDRIVRNEIGLK